MKILHSGKTTGLSLLLVAILFAVFFHFFQERGSGVLYSVFRIDDIDRNASELGHFAVFVTSLNDSGQVAGNLGGIKKCLGFVWDRERGITVLDYEDNQHSIFTSMNDAGIAVGSRYIRSDTSHAIMWNEAEGSTDLGFLEDEFTHTFDINNDADVLVKFETAKESGVAVWRAGEIIRSVSTPQTERVQSAELNDIGRVFVWTNDASNWDRIYEWNSENGLDLLQQGSFLSSGGGFKLNVNNHNRLALTRRLGSDGDLPFSRWEPNRACLVSASEGLRELKIEENEYTEAYDQNNNGTVVGLVRSFGWKDMAALKLLHAVDARFGGDRHGEWYYRVETQAVMWKDGERFNLSDLVPRKGKYTFSQALAVNDRGEILCRGRQDGQFALFLLTPTEDSERTQGKSRGRT